MKKLCVVCNDIVEKGKINRSFNDLFCLANSKGTYWLTDKNKMVVEGKICSLKCYNSLD